MLKEWLGILLVGIGVVLWVEKMTLKCDPLFGPASSRQRSDHKEINSCLAHPLKVFAHTYGFQAAQDFAHVITASVGWSKRS